MSAIFGIWSEVHPDERRIEMLHLRSYLAYRGPDASGIWMEGAAALGNCLLQTTPESIFEAMPSAAGEGTLRITADVRLDNRTELISALGLGNLPAATVTDSRLILEAYLRWGEACPGRLLGDFAFAIWDRRTQTLFCARDHFGIKPFYYCATNGSFAFCSCVDGLLQLGWIPRRLNEQRLASHLTTFYGDTAATFYADIIRLPPAHCLRINHQGVRLTRYWDLDAAAETRRAADREYVEAFKAIFLEAVKARLRSRGPCGAMLSGGLDSSSIAASAGRLMRESGRGPLATFSAVYDDVPRSDERKFIETLVRKGGFSPSFLAADQCDPFDIPAELARTQAEVHAGANLFLNWGIYKLARQGGVKVMLDGFDGDTTLSHGTDYLTELARGAQWFKLLRLAPAVAGVSGHSAALLFWNYFWQEGLQPRLPAAAQQICRGLARRWHLARGSGLKSCCVLDRNFSDRIGFRAYRAGLRATSSPGARTERESHYQKLMWGVMPATLEMLDQTAAPFGVEVRLPFWDRRLVEFCLGLPPEFKIRNGFTRWILREAMDGLLPKEVQWRRDKSNLGHGFKHCLMKHGLETLIKAETAARKWVRPYACPRHLNESRRRFEVEGGDEETLFLWQVANLAIWLERTGLKA